VPGAPAEAPNDTQDVAVNLYWLPLGAGGHSVRFDGLVYDAAAAQLGHRPACNLYHPALEVRMPEGRFVIEQTPVPDNQGATRGVVAGHQCPASGTLPLTGIVRIDTTPPRVTGCRDVARRLA
jgi:hypothetical protein